MKRTTKIGSIPVADKGAKLKPRDFSAILSALPADCVLIGGQAVAWWAERYGIKAIINGQERFLNIQWPKVIDGEHTAPTGT